MEAGADKVSINSPALENPTLITALATEYGVQCVVVGIDSRLIDGGILPHLNYIPEEVDIDGSNVNTSGDQFVVWQYTGSESHSTRTSRSTRSWIKEVIDRGAGEIVLNCMNQDGKRSGYDLAQLAVMRSICNVPLVASGGAGSMVDFEAVFKETSVDAALAASVFHKNIFSIAELKEFLVARNVAVRPLQ